MGDGARLALEHQFTFYKPSKQAVELLSVGDEVKLIFERVSGDKDGKTAERMWVKVTLIDEGAFEGTLANDPVVVDDLSFGDRVRFEEKHIIQVSIEDPVPDPTEKYRKRCFVTSKIMDEGMPIRYLYRERPDQEDDSGWRILAGDETDEYMEGKGNIQYVSLGAVLSKDSSIVEIIGRDDQGDFMWDEHFKGFRECAR